MERIQDRQKESIESWEKSVTHDREVIKYDIAMTASGAVISGMGIYMLLKGNITEGVVITGVGATVAGTSAKNAFEDVNMLADSAETLGAKRVGE
jgi:hypothetical protein